MRPKGPVILKICDDIIKKEGVEVGERRMRGRGSRKEEVEGEERTTIDRAAPTSREKKR